MAQLNAFRLSLTLILFLFSALTFGQKKFKVTAIETGNFRSKYVFTDEKGNTIRELDTSKYFTCFTTNSKHFVYFAILGMKGLKEGWAAVDADENILFTVLNTSYGEPTPDDLWEDAIRIIDSNNLIGFANSKGKIFIKPQFEAASTFHNGKAIIARSCKQEPWDEHAKESDCHHYSTVCTEHGYINKKGKIKKLGAFSFEEIKNEIKWVEPNIEYEYYYD